METPGSRELVSPWIVLGRVVLAGVLWWIAFALLTLGLMFGTDVVEPEVAVTTAPAGAIAGAGVWSVTGVVPLRRVWWFAGAGAVLAPLLLYASFLHASIWD